MESLDGDAGLVSRIEASLRRGIVRGELPDGSKLRQDHIAAAFGTTAAPVREALRRLENARLVISRPRRGVVVAPILPADALEVAEMRAALECLALRLAMPNATHSDFVAARIAITRVATTSNIEDWVRENRAFHLALYRPCARQRLLQTIEDLWLTSDRHLYRVWAGVDYHGTSDAQHRAIVAACEAGKFTAAAKLLSEHILSAGRTLEQLLAAASRAA